MSHIPQLLRVLRRFLTENSAFRCSVRCLLWLWDLLRRQMKRMDRFGARKSPTYDSSTRTIRYDFSRTNSSPNNDTVYASTVPSSQAVSLLSPLASIRQSQEVAPPYMVEHELGDLSVSIPAQTLDQRFHLDAAIPAGYSPQDLEVKRKAVVFEPILPNSAVDQRYDRDAIMYVSSFAPRNPSQNVSPIDQGHIPNSCSKSWTMIFPCIYLE